MDGNDCHGASCDDHTSSSSWLFGLGPGPPQRFEPTGTDTTYQYVRVDVTWADYWPAWGDYGGSPDLLIGTSGAPGGSHGCLLYTSPSPRDA